MGTITTSSEDLIHGTKTCGKEYTTMKVAIKNIKTDIRDAKLIEVLSANAERINALIDYIAACDHPEILEDETEDANE